MADRRPDFFLHSGDAIYADGPVPGDAEAERRRHVPQRHGTAAKDHVAQTLDDFRGNYAYNLTDEHYRRFTATVPQLIQWDDHEVLNNWFPGESLAGQNRKGYTETDVNELAGYAYQAWREWQPVEPSEAADGRRVPQDLLRPAARRVRAGHAHLQGPQPAGLGARPTTAASWAAKQTQWLIDGLNDVDGGVEGGRERPADQHRRARHGVRPDRRAAVDGGGRAGRQRRAAGPRDRVLAHPLRRPRTCRTSCTSRPTCTTPRRSPTTRNAPRSTDFSPFWEFVSGPLNAGAFPQSPLDGTFGAQYEFVHAPEKANTSPAEGFQHFGEVVVDSGSRSLTVNLRDAKGTALYTKELAPA